MADFILVSQSQVFFLLIIILRGIFKQWRARRRAVDRRDEDENPAYGNYYDPEPRVEGENRNANNSSDYEAGKCRTTDSNPYYVCWDFFCSRHFQTPACVWSTFHDSTITVWNLWNSDESLFQQHGTQVNDAVSVWTLNHTQLSYIFTFKQSCRYFSDCMESSRIKQFPCCFPPAKAL